MAQRIAALPARRIWLTSWDADMVTHLEKWFGWAPAPVLQKSFSPQGKYSERDPSRARPTWWKLDAAIDWLSTNPVSQVVWFDDELAVHRAAARRHLTPVGVTARLCAPNQQIGLTSQDLTAAHNWLRLSH